MSKIRYLHEDMSPILPAVGDIRILPILNFNYDPNLEKPKIPICKLKVVKCVEHLEHHVVFKDIKTEEQIAIPLEMAVNYGYLSIDEAMKWILNSYMESIIAFSKEKTSYNVFSSFKDNSQISEYYERMKNLVLLSRNVLKEAEKAKNLYEKELERKN